ncbi:MULTISPECIES: hypothetical protein [Rhizobium]|uniref:Uncharacterized protein n=1 Tax=Rhizobium rhododendri TaxID=2506430 RepID=A0ABY8IQ76_9HYPH|nr:MULTISPECIES: hypothetical protein [Rhizobium]MBO9099398.1 hypothetical protein [Rhizobium sp. L58/93]QXZ87113.1 hypothetical protein J5287_21255 [Rhizobium sp. K1/93]QXZ92853.1 hypothetical protein J5280_19640 [Rhizobium sp. K15/93]WFS25190.1 hypothetical protein PR018_23270 [Rhizobium rhododendri]
MSTRIKYIFIAFVVSIGLWSSLISGAVWISGKSIDGIDMSTTAAVSDKR